MSAPEWVNAWEATDTVRVALSIPRSAHPARSRKGGVDINATRSLTRAILDGDIPARRVGDSAVVAKAKWKSVADADGDLPLHEIELNRAALYNWIKQHEPSQIPSGAKRGRKAHWDWEECIMHVGKRIFDQGLPEQQSILEDWIAEYFNDTRGGSPAESDIRDRAHKLWKLYKAGN